MQLLATSLTIGAGPGTGLKRHFRSGILVGNFEVSRRSVCSGNFPVGQTKIALPFTVQPKFADFFFRK